MTNEFSDAERERVRAAKAAGGADGRKGTPGAIANSAVGRLLSGRAPLQRKGGDAAGGTVDDDVAARIDGRRGGGQALDAGAGERLGAAFQHDFSDVRVHTDAEADRLNGDVHAEAFTAGRDIFFRAGAYNPGSAAGQRLLAHELTHVVQQRGASAAPGAMRVSDPADASEREADAMADEVMTSPSRGASGVARQAEVPEEEELQTSIAREAEEEEEVQMSVAREAEEEEEVQMSVARQAAMEDEEEMPEAR